IVAVFLPVGLMPGISGQFFKNFGLTVVAAVVMSLAVARMITPMVAADFLQAKGHAAPGEGKMMDRCMAVLSWTLESDKARAIRARLEPAPLTWQAFIAEALFISAIFLALVYGGREISEFLGTLELWPSIAFVLTLLGSVAAAVLAGWALTMIFRRIEWGYIGAYHDFFLARFRARFHDHRLWMFGLGIGALVLTVSLL